ncbi:MFS transporter [Nocardioides sp. InS609-2]|uniref:MFS transporter n=1 Tax=Nocardioides sp. InS609-2 TaxID=2760705 RepID=UPI0020BF07A9|nr:MFS transporter [Nocardioides sp. InS609-2]
MRRLNVFLVGYFLSAVGSGLTFPYIAIYMDQVRGFGGAGAAVALVVMAVASLVGSLAAAARLDRSGVRAVAFAGLLAQAVGYSAIGLAGLASAAYAACALTGFGGGLFFASLAPAISALCGPELHRTAFARRYQVNNLGIGVGALCGIALITQLDVATFQLLYLLNGTSYLVLGVVLLAVLPGWSPVPHSEPGMTDPGSERAKFRDLLHDRNLRLLLMVQALLVAAGFSQMQSVVPLYITEGMQGSPTLVNTILVLNCAGIVIFQPLIVILGRTWSTASLLAAVGVVWAVAFCLGIGGSFGGAAGQVAIIAFCLTFTIGECFYGPSFQTLLMEVAPPDRVGQYSGAASSLWGVMNFSAPPLGVLLVNSPWPVSLWVVCAICSAMAGVLCWKLRRSVMNE